MSLSSVMRAVLDGRNKAELNLGIVCRVIVCGMRHMPGAVTKQLAEVIEICYCNHI